MMNTTLVKSQVIQSHNSPRYGKLHKQRRPTRRSVKRLQSGMHIFCLKNDQEPSSIYDSYDLEEEELVVEVQRDLFTIKWGESSQQQVFQEDPKTKRICRVYHCLWQKDSCQEFSVDSSIYDSHSLDNEESIADFLKSLRLRS